MNQDERVTLTWMFICLFVFTVVSTITFTEIYYLDGLEVFEKSVMSSFFSSGFTFFLTLLVLYLGGDLNHESI